MAWQFLTLAWAAIITSIRTGFPRTFISEVMVYSSTLLHIYKPCLCGTLEGSEKQIGKMKTRHLLFLLVVVFAPLFAHAQDEVTVGEIKYKLYSVGAYVSGTTTKNIVVADIASAITDGTNSYKVIGIDNSAFSYCSGLLLVTIPNSVTSIGESAFSGCSNMTTVSIPGSVTTIGAYAFRNCTAINSLTLNSGLRSIGVEAFSGCSKITTVSLPASVIALGHRAFANCTSLTKITTPSGLMSLGDEVFKGCSALTSISLPSTVTNMGNAVFSLTFISRTCVNGHAAVSHIRRRRMVDNADAIF